MFMETLFIQNYPKLEIIKCFSIGEWINKLQYILAMEYHPGIKILRITVIYNMMNPQNIKLS